MNVMDQLQADVLTAFNGPLHGRLAKYYVVGDVTGVAMNIIVKPDSWQSMFDTGADTLDFQMLQCFIGRNDLATTPKETGRGTVGDTIIFQDFLSVTWWIRNVASTPDYSGAYYDVLISNYNGPINGV